MLKIIIIILQRYIQFINLFNILKNESKDEKSILVIILRIEIKTSNFLVKILKKNSRK